MTTTLTLRLTLQQVQDAAQDAAAIPNFKVVIYSVPDEAAFRYALAFVNTVEPTARGGLARAYYTRAGLPLATLEEVIQAVLNDDLSR